MNASLIVWRNKNSKISDLNYSGCTRLTYIDNREMRLSYNMDEFMLDGSILHQKSINSEHNTLCPCPIQDKDIPHGKYVIHCFLSLPPAKISYENNQDNIDIPNIKYHIYKGFGHYKGHGQIPLCVTSRCDFYHKIEDDQAVICLQKIQEIVLMNTKIKSFLFIIMYQK